MHNLTYSALISYPIQLIPNFWAATHSLPEPAKGTTIWFKLDGKIDGTAIRLPTSNVSLIDLTFISKRKTTIKKINNEIIKASKTNNLKGILTTNNLPLVSKDFNHNPSSSIFDITQTQVINGNFCRILSWYDNEWGFSNRMIDTTLDLRKFI